MPQFSPRAPRRSVAVQATMRVGGPRVLVCIRNISARGILVEARQLPARGSYVEIIGPANSLTGRVVWVRNGHFALRTRERLDIAAALGANPEIKQEEVPAGVRGEWKATDQSYCAEGNRHLGLQLQSGAFVLFAVLTSVGIAGLVYIKLAPTFARIAAALALA